MVVAALITSNGVLCGIKAAFHDTDILAVSGDFPVQHATGITSGNRTCRTLVCRRVGRVGVGVDVGVVECGLNDRAFADDPKDLKRVRISAGRFHVTASGKVLTRM